MDPLSGPFANVGQNQLKSWQFIAERYSAQKNPAGVKFEIVGFDNKGSPAGEPERAQGRPSTRASATSPRATARAPALAILDAVDKHNERNPGKEVRVPELRGGGPGLTNEQVQLLALPPRRRHRHEDGGADHLHEGPAEGQEGLPAQPELLARPAGRQVRQGAIARKRPDVKIVGEDLHPIGAGQGLRALRRQDQGIRRRHRHHRQLGRRPGAADQGANDAGLKIANSTPTTPA